MKTNKKLIAVAEIGSDKMIQFWARTNTLAQVYNNKSTDLVYSVVKLPDFDNLFRFFVTTEQEVPQETLLEYCHDFLNELQRLIPDECARMTIADRQKS